MRRVTKGAAFLVLSWERTSLVGPLKVPFDLEGMNMNAFWFGGHEYELARWGHPILPLTCLNLSSSFFLFSFFCSWGKISGFILIISSFPKLRLQLISWSWSKTMFFVFIFFKWTEPIQKIWNRTRKHVQALYASRTSGLPVWRANRPTGVRLGSFQPSHLGWYD